MRDLRRPLWAEPRPPHAPSPGRPDRALAGALAVLAVTEFALRPDLPRRVASLLTVLVLLPVLPWRRTRPLATVATAFGTTSLALLATGGAAPGLYTTAFLLLLPYALVRWGSGREIVIGTAVLLAGVALAVTVRWEGAGDLVGRLAVLSASTALGAAVRFRAGARLRELDRVKLLERERLARELHDTVAHHVSAMAIRAQAGIAVEAARPGAATEALRVIEAEASRALAEMRAMVRVLRTDDSADLTPVPGLAGLRRLAEEGHPGPPVVVTISGDTGACPPAVASAVHRLARESVTNARRHARRASRIDVVVRVEEAVVRLRVSDDGEPVPAGPAGAPGYGLIGMAERADLLGGTLRAGPGPGRGWTVTAVLPRGEVPA